MNNVRLSNNNDDRIVTSIIIRYVSLRNRNVSAPSVAPQIFVVVLYFAVTVDARRSIRNYYFWIFRWANVLSFSLRQNESVLLEHMPGKTKNRNFRCTIICRVYGVNTLCVGLRCESSTNKKHKLKHTQSITADEEGRKIICFLGMALFLNAPLLFNGTCTISGKVVRRLIWTKWNCRFLSPSWKFAKSFFPIQNFTTSWIIVENLEFYA